MWVMCEPVERIEGRGEDRGAAEADGEVDLHGKVSMGRPECLPLRWTSIRKDLT